MITEKDITDALGAVKKMREDMNNLAQDIFSVHIRLQFEKLTYEKAYNFWLKEVHEKSERWVDCKCCIRAFVDWLKNGGVSKKRWRNLKPFFSGLNKAYAAFKNRNHDLVQLLDVRSARERGVKEGNERALTLADEMTEMKKRHKAELEELKARQRDELRLLQKKYEPRWKSHKITSTNKRQLQGEFAWLFQTITNDANSVRAGEKNKGLKFDALRAEILTTFWNRLPSARRKGVWMARDGSFSYESLKRHHSKHLKDFKPAPSKDPEHIKPETDNDPYCDGDL